jgi:hypothetical protein
MQDIQTTKYNKERVKSVDNYFKSEPASSYRSPGEGPSTSRGYLLLGFVVSVVLIGAIIFLASYVFNGANVVIKPVNKEMQINETFVVSETERADLLATQSVVTSDVQALPKNTVKKVSRKASGTITIYNNHNTTAQKLIKGTRFSTAAGKIFRIEEGVTVPGKSGTTPGSVTARVVADTEGEGYNIPPSKFTIPGFKGSPKYNNFYAESKSAMTGGTSGKSAEVSDLDMEKGKETLKQNIEKSLSGKLEGDAPAGFVFDKNLVITEYASPVMVDEDNNTASYSLSATGTALYLKKELLIKKIVEKTQNIDNASGGVDIKDASDFVISVIDPGELSDTSKPIRFIVTGNAQVVFYPSKEKIVSYLAGQPASVFADMAKQIPFIESATHVMRPFWASSFPKDPSKINVIIE